MPDRTRIEWPDFLAGMRAARTPPDVAMQATMAEAKAYGGPDFAADENSRSWHLGYDHAIKLARKSCRSDQMPGVRHG